MSRLALYLLGPPQIEYDGVPVKADRRKAIALLAYIAATGESHRRASLVNLLWPDHDRPRGRAALRQTLFALKRAIPGAWLDVDRQEVALNPTADIWIDVDQFRQLLARCEAHGHAVQEVCPTCVHPLTEAVALYRGDFMSGFGLRDSANFDDWQFFQTDALRRQLASVLERLVLWYSIKREFDVATGYAKRWLALDELDEQVHCQLMRLYAWSGRRPAALRQYDVIAGILDDQLGVPPQQATTELRAAIAEGRPPPPPTGRESEPEEAIPQASLFLPAQAPSFLEAEEPVERPVFVARERELAQLDQFLHAALAGHGKVVFVTGEAGSGKTALLQEFGRRAQGGCPGLIVAWGHGNAHTGVGDPYLPFREVLSLLSGDVEAQWAAGAMTGEQARRLWDLLPLTLQALLRVGPDLIDLFVPGIPLLERALGHSQCPAGSPWLAQLEGLVDRRASTSSNPSLQQNALFEQYTQVLRDLANQSPLLLALDDLQWADGGSTNLLFHLGRRLEGTRILIAVAYRAAEVALGRLTLPEREGDRERHLLQPVVNEFKRYFGGIEVDLERAQRREFVDALLDSEPNRLGAGFRETLYRHTRGHPLFTVELLQGMQARGELTQDPDGRWAEGLALDWETLPARVEAVIAERIARLPERLRAALTVASVEGETFTAEVVARQERMEESKMVRCLSNTLDKQYGLVSARGVVRLGSRHLSRYRFQHILYQKHLYGRLDPVERVHLHQAVGTALEVLYGQAGEEALAVEAGAAQMARHFEEAGIPEKAVDYLCQAGERARRLYANAEAAEHFRRALGLLDEATLSVAPTNCRLEMLPRICEGLGDVLEWTGEHDEARAAYRRALDHVPAGDRFWTARLHRKAGNIWRLQHRYDRAGQAYDLAEEALGSGVGEVGAAWWQEWVQIQLERMWLYYWLGSWREISGLADQVRPAVEKYGTPTQCISFFLSLASMYNRRDRYVVSEETLSFCRMALAISLETEDLSEIAWARFLMGFSQQWSGDLDGAERQMQAALVLAERTGDVVHQSRCLTYLTTGHRLRGDVDKAREHVSRGLAAATAGQMIEYVGMAKANSAWLAWREGKLAEAEAQGREAVELWIRLPAGHSSCAFQWTAIWPLVGVMVAQDRISEASEFARTLLDDLQQRLPDALTTTVEAALRAWETGEAGAAEICLRQAIALAQEMGYL